MKKQLRNAFFLFLIANLVPIGLLLVLIVHGQTWWPMLAPLLVCTFFTIKTFRQWRACPPDDDTPITKAEWDDFNSTEAEDAAGERVVLSAMRAFHAANKQVPK